MTATINNPIATNTLLSKQSIRAEMLRLAGLYLDLSREEALAALKQQANAGADSSALMEQMVASTGLCRDVNVSLIARVARELDFIDEDMLQATMPLAKGRRRKGGAK